MNAGGAQGRHEAACDGSPGKAHQVAYCSQWRGAALSRLWGACASASACAAGVWVHTQWKRVNVHVVASKGAGSVIPAALSQPAWPMASHASMQLFITCVQMHAISCRAHAMLGVHVSLAMERMGLETACVPVHASSCVLPPSCHHVSEVAMHHTLQKEGTICYLCTCPVAVTPKYHRYAQIKENICIPSIIM